MSFEGAFVEISSKEQFESLIKQDTGNILVIHFSANWAEQCKQVQEVLLELKKKLLKTANQVEFVEIQAEKFPEISKKFKVEAVPTCIIIKKSKEIARINGVNTVELVKIVEEQCSNLELKPEKNLNDYLKSLINQSPVMVFLKGSSDAPKCGFCKTLVQLLNEQKVIFKSFDILKDEEVRQGLKEYSNWPTYPQVYVNGELVGGLDIVQKLISDGEFASMIPTTDPLEDQLKALINKGDVMLFMKGSPDSPKCGFSKSIIQVLNSKNVKFSYFDILTNDEIREGLKSYSNWPTYPQLYVKGELIGGLDIVKEMDKNGELDKLFADI